MAAIDVMVGGVRVSDWRTWLFYWTLLATANGEDLVGRRMRKTAAVGFIDRRGFLAWISG